MFQSTFSLESHQSLGQMENLVAAMTDRLDSSRLRRVVIGDKIVDEGGESEGEGEAAREEAVRKNLTL